VIAVGVAKGPAMNVVPGTVDALDTCELDEETDDEEVEVDDVVAASGCVAEVEVEAVADDVVEVVDATRFAEEEDATFVEGEEWVAD